MSYQTTDFTRLTCCELLALAATLEFHTLCGLDARAELHRRLAELKERRRQRWAEEWLVDAQGWVR